MINTYNETHEGHLPIRVLQHNIIHHFENTSRSFLETSKYVIERWGMSPEIDYLANIDGEKGHKLRWPNICNKTKTICIQETFWVICGVCHIHYVALHQS